MKFTRIKIEISGNWGDDMGKIFAFISRVRKSINNPPPRLTDEERKKVGERQEQEKMALRLKREQSRKKIEKYKARKTGGWGCLPALLLFGCSIWVAVCFLKGDTSIVWLFVPVGFSWWIMVAAMNVGKEWDATEKCKRELLSPNSKYDWDSGLYSEEYLYTDSLWDISIYKIAQGISYIITVVAFGLLALYWLEQIPKIIDRLNLKTIGIILICLLLLVIHNQTKNNDH